VTHLVQILLPRADETVARELAERFGGVTAYSRAPARGLWKPAPGSTERDDIVVLEVMVEALEAGWWRTYRESLERRFRQDEIVVRAHPIERL